MKTKLLILAALVFAGLTFSSCSKDNSFQPDETISVTNPPSDQTGQDYEFHPGDVFKLTPLDGDPNPGGIGNDMITNFPDPFRNYTTIVYHVSGNSILAEQKKVTLTVYNRLGNKVAVLVNDELQRPGRYLVKFDASKLPYGIYTARLEIRSENFSALYEEKMIKSALSHQDDETTLTD